MIGILVAAAYLLIGYLIGLGVIWYEIREIRKRPHFTQDDLDRYHREHNGAGIIVITMLTWPALIVIAILVFGTEFIIKRF